MLYTVPLKVHNVSENFETLFTYYLIIIIIIIFSTILFRTQGECTKGVYFNILILEYVNCYYYYMNKYLLII